MIPLSASRVDLKPFDAVSACVMVLDSEGIIRHLNTAGQRFLGEQTVGEPLWQTPLSSTLLDEQLSPLSKEAKAEFTASLQHLLKQKSGSRCWYSRLGGDGHCMRWQLQPWRAEASQAAELCEAREEATLWLLTGSDLSPVANLLDDQRQQLTFQRRQLDMVGAITSGLAHDFNNLFTVIIGNLRLLQNDHTLTADDLQEILSDAVNACQDGIDLNHSLWSFAKQRPARPKATDLDHWLRHYGQLLKRTLAPPFSLTLQLPKVPTAQRLIVDRLQLEKVAMWIIVQAPTIMPAGGNIALALIESAGNSTLQGASLRFSLVPSGLPPPSSEVPSAAAEAPAIPSPFDAAGLNALLAGTPLEAFVTYGWQGQALVITLGPFERAAKSGTARAVQDSTAVDAVHSRSRRPKQAKVGAADHHPTILVVDDDPNVRKTTTRSLTQLGYRVLEAQNGKEAQEILNHANTMEGIAMVFSDIFMPIMDGFQLGEWLRRHYPHMPILLTTAYSQQALTDHTFRILNKPFTIAQLSAEIQSTLRQRPPLAKH